MGGPWPAEEQKNHINIFELKAGQIGYFNIYPYAPKIKVNSLANGQYCGSAI